MKLYIKAMSSYAGDIDKFDVKKELKQKYKRDTRRQDTFIHLALYGALTLKDKIQIQEDDELYITSGVGNIEVVQKANLCVNVNKELLRPFDFINSLGNTTSYHVASALGLNGKNIFQISNNFTFINTLISVYASLLSSNKEAILGSVDLQSSPKELLQRVLGVPKGVSVISAVNYQKISLKEEGALAVLEFDTRVYTLVEMEEITTKYDGNIIFSRRDKEGNNFFETEISYFINQALKKGESLLFVDSMGEQYKLLYLKV